jgi:hypothetical protein
MGDVGLSVSALPDGGAIVTGRFFRHRHLRRHHPHQRRQPRCVRRPHRPERHLDLGPPRRRRRRRPRNGVSALRRRRHRRRPLPGHATFGATTLTSAGASDVFVATHRRRRRLDLGPTRRRHQQRSAIGLSALPDGGAIVTGASRAPPPSAPPPSPAPARRRVRRPHRPERHLDLGHPRRRHRPPGGGRRERAPRRRRHRHRRDQRHRLLRRTTLTSSGLGDAFVARIDPNGTWTWAPAPAAPMAPTRGA